MTTPMTTVLFVCVHNAGRSQMAEAFTNRLAQERGLPMRAISAGTVAQESINPVVVEVMGEAGVPLDGQHPKQLTAELFVSSVTTATAAATFADTGSDALKAA